MRRDASEKYSATQARIALRSELIAALDSAAKNSGLSIRGAAKKIGIDSSRLAKILKSEGREITIDSMILYLSRLGITVKVSITNEVRDDSRTICSN